MVYQQESLLLSLEWAMDDSHHCLGHGKRYNVLTASGFDAATLIDDH
jgi:hypothetical protein